MKKDEIETFFEGTLAEYSYVPYPITVDGCNDSMDVRRPLKGEAQKTPRKQNKTVSVAAKRSHNSANTKCLCEYYEDFNGNGTLYIKKDCPCHGKLQCGSSGTSR